MGLARISKRIFDHWAATGQVSRGAAAIAGIYALISCLWIAFSDEILARLESDADLLTRYSILNGWVFVFLTAALLFLLVYRFGTRLANGEARVRTLSLAVDQSPNSIIVTNLAGEIEYVNDAFVEISGYGRDEVIGRNPRLLQSGWTPPETFRSLWGALRAGRSWHGEFRNRRKNGDLYVELAHIAPVHQLDGRITHYLAIKEDITEKTRIAQELDRHRADLERLVTERTAELEELAELNRHVIRSSAQGILAYDGGGACVLANEAAARILDTTVSRLLAQNFHELDSWRASSLYHLVAETLANGKEGHREVQMTTSWGSEVWIDVVVSTFLSRGARHVLLTVSDVGPFRRAEIALAEARDRADAASRAQSAFLANVSHDLRTPLTAIKGSLSLVNHRVLGELPAAVRELTEIAETSCSRLIRLVNDLLDFEKLSTGGMSLSISDVNVVELLEAAVGDIGGLAGTCGVTLRRTGHLPRGAAVVGDADRLIQVLDNLLSNAVKFSGRGSEVVVSADITEDGQLRVAVRDQGPGIPENFRPRLFERFSQAAEAGRRAGGTGLGLAITKELVERQGGSIGFECGAEGGTTFWVRLPLANR